MGSDALADVQRGYARPGVRWRWGLRLAAAVACAAGPARAERSEVLTVTNLHQLHALAAQARPTPGDVRLEGVVCAASVAERALVLQDDSGSELLRVDLLGQSLAPGQRLRLEGQGCELLRRQIGIEIRRRPLVNNDGVHGMFEVASAPVRLSAGHLPVRLEWFNSGGALGLEVGYEGPGLARRSIPAEALAHTRTDAKTGGAAFGAGLDYAYYQGSWTALPDFARLVPVRTGAATNFDLAVRGQDDHVGLVFCGLLDIPRGGDYRFFVTSDDGSQLFLGSPLPTLTVLSAASIIAPRRLEIAQKLEAGAGNQWAVVEGTAVFVGEGLGGLELELANGRHHLQVQVVDPTGLAPASLLRQHLRITGLCPAPPVDQAEPAAELMVTVSSPQVEVLPPPYPSPAADPQTSNGLPRLVSAEQVQRLSRTEAERGYPVTLQGVVTGVAPWFYYGLVLQDETRGIFVNYTPLTNHPAPFLGERWEVQGMTGAGIFAPMVEAQRLRFLGHAPLPEPVQPTWDQLINGSLDTQYIQMRGLVTETRDDVLFLLTQWGKIQVRIANPNATPLRTYENSLVRIRGCLLALWDATTHQVKVGDFQLVSALIDVDQPMPADPFSATAKTVPELRLFDLGASRFQRVKVAAQFLAEHNGECFLAQQTNGLRFVPITPPALQPGDLIEVAGFPDLAGPSPVLREAVARRVGRAPLPSPQPLQPEEVVEPRFDATRVRLEAALVSCRHARGEQVLELQSGLRLFVARLPGRHRALESLPPGCRLELTGVYAAQGGSPALQRGIDSFELLLRSPGDARVLARPPWWTLRRSLTGLAAMTVVLGAAMLWAFTLNRRVIAQTRLIRQKVEREATLEERARIARELHDTLEQAIAGIGLQLSALAAALREAPAEALRMLSVARSMVHHGQEEARRTVQNLRLLALEKADLPAALGQMASPANASGPPRIEVHIFGHPVPLPSAVETHLLRIGQEATANALKHAHPTRVCLELRYTADTVQLEIADDGCGFQIPPATVGAAGHFGLLGMRERADKIGATLNLLSSPGDGTRVQVEVHLPYRGPDETLRLRFAAEAARRPPK